MKCSCFCTVILLGISFPATYSRHVQFYRKDYTYIEAFDAFYKVHWDDSVISWNKAFSTCDDEGAILFYPKAKGEWTLVKNLTDMMNEVPNVTDIFVGFHDEFRLGEFFTVDGQLTPYPLPTPYHLPPVSTLLLPPGNCITMNIDTGLFKVDSCLRMPDTPLPFVCKKVDDESCPTIDHGYKYVKISRKCYKINKKPKTWQEAMRTCFMEGGILTVIEDRAQAEEIRQMLDMSQLYFVGIRKLFSYKEYYSVKGQKFSDVFQNQQYFNGDYDCVAVRTLDNINLYTLSVSCTDALPFICEMEVVT